MRNSLTQQRASNLRKQLTDAEQHLWQQLRRKQIAGARFRRQVPIGSYIADFACVEIKLIIELDGSQHLLAQDYDQRRTCYLESQGYRVLRFWSNEVLQQSEAMLTVILREVQGRIS